MLAAYLTHTEGHYKHYFIAVTQVKGKWTVRTAWGRIGKIQDDKDYTGGASGPFDGEQNAIRYANAVIKNKVDGGYVTQWATTDLKKWPKLDDGSVYKGPVPDDWWDEVVEWHSNGGKSSKPPDRKKRVVGDGSDSRVDPQPVKMFEASRKETTVEKINRLAERISATDPDEPDTRVSKDGKLKKAKTKTVKTRDGDADFIVLDKKPEPEEKKESSHGTRKPRFQFS